MIRALGRAASGLAVLGLVASPAAAQDCPPIDPGEYTSQLRSFITAHAAFAGAVHQETVGVDTGGGSLGYLALGLFGDALSDFSVDWRLRLSTYQTKSDDPAVDAGFRYLVRGSFNYASADAYLSEYEAKTLKVETSASGTYREFCVGKQASRSHSGFGVSVQVDGYTERLGLGLNWSSISSTHNEGDTDYEHISLLYFLGTGVGVSLLTERLWTGQESFAIGWGLNLDAFANRVGSGEDEEWDLTVLLGVTGVLGVANVL